MTKEELIQFGMVETTGDERVLFPLKKIISVDNEDEESEGELAICLTTMRNQADLCLMMPDGACLYLAPQNIEQLKAFEKCIASWEPNY